MKGLLLFLFCFLLISVRPGYGTCSGTLTPRQQDSCQLVNLYHSLNLDEWTTLNWNIGTNPMELWFGVKLNSAGRVTKLSIYNSKMNGSFPANFELPELDTLALYHNSVNVANCISDGLPDFSNFPNLKYVDLSNNCFTAELPNTLPATLKYFKISNSGLTGTLKNYALPDIEYFNVEKNKLQGVLYDFDMPNLKELYLNNNQLSGALPDYSLPNLKRLIVNNNSLTGNIQGLENCNRLEMINLNVNNFQGEIPNFNLPYLRTLTIVNNPDVTGSLPAFNLLDSLRIIEVCTTKVSGVIPTFSNNLKIESIVLTDNSLSDTIPNYAHSTLKKLQLSRNSITGKLPDFHLPLMEEINTSANHITGNIPNFNQMPKLKRLYLQDNCLSGDLPSLNLPSLEILQWAANSFSGTLNADFINHLPKIKTIYLQGNQLHGVIPEFESATLEQLYLAFNRFKGPLPDLLGALKVKVLLVDNNYLTGNIPDYKAQTGRDTSNMYLNVTRNYFNFTNLATSSYNTIDNYAYRSQVIPLEFDPVTNELSVDAGFVYSQSENSYTWQKKCGSNTVILSETGSAITLPQIPDDCHYQCIVTNSILTKSDPVKLITTTGHSGTYKEIGLTSYFYKHSNVKSSLCEYIGDTLQCPDISGTISQKIIYKGDSLFSKGKTPLWFKFPGDKLTYNKFQTTSGLLGELNFQTASANQISVLLPDYASEFLRIPGKPKKVIGHVPYRLKNNILSAGSQFDFSEIEMDNICATCDTLDADFLYLYAINTDSTNSFDKNTGTITIPFKYIDYRYNTAAPTFKIYYSKDGTNTPLSYEEVSSSNIQLRDSIYFVKFTLPPAAVKAGYLINLNSFKYKIDAVSESGRNFSIISDYYVDKQFDMNIVGYTGKQEDRFDIIENLRNPSCEMYWYVLINYPKTNTLNTLQVLIKINNELLFSGNGLEMISDDGGWGRQTAIIQRGGFKVTYLPSCYKIEAANGNAKTFIMDYKLVCKKRE